MDRWMDYHSDAMTHTEMIRGGWKMIWDFYCVTDRGTKGQMDQQIDGLTHLWTYCWMDLQTNGQTLFYEDEPRNNRGWYKIFTDTYKY